MFWGRIRGSSFDYFIALGLKFTGNKFPKKRFYYCTSKDYDFKNLPKMNRIFDKKINQMTNEFTGEPDKELNEEIEVIITPAKIIKKIDKQENDNDIENEDNNIEEDIEKKLEDNEEIISIKKEDQEEDDDKNGDQNFNNENDENYNTNEDLEKDYEIVEPEKREEIIHKLTEKERLGFVVRAIEWECSIYPTGAYKEVSNNELRPFLNFKGLSLDSSRFLENWIHFRDIKNSIKYDQPLNCWSIVPNCTNNGVD